MRKTMTRSTLWLAVVLALTGCERQVNIDEADVVGSTADVSPTPVSPATNPPVELPDPVVPVVSDTGNEQTEMPDEAPSDPPTSDVPEEGTEVAIRSVAVRLDEPELLSVSAGLMEFTPVLTRTDGNQIDMRCCDANGGWLADVQLDSNAQWAGAIQWNASVDGDDVVALEAEVQLSDPQVGLVDISAARYERFIDSDGDGVGNLTELITGTDPLNLDDVSEDFLSARVRIPRVASTEVPAIDGRAGGYEPNTTRFSGEWSEAVHIDVDGNRLSIDNLMFASAGFATDAENHHWLALHDGTWLYLLVVIDDAGEHHVDSREIDKPWRDDSIELFFDGDNSQAQSYDQVDDFSMHLLTLNAEANGANSSSDANPNVFRSVNSVPLPSGLSFATGPLQGPSAPDSFASNGINQDVFEIALRISDINIELGRTFGFEVQFDDDDDAGDRDAKWGWMHPSGTSAANDFTWFIPSVMGRAVLLP